MLSRYRKEAMNLNDRAGKVGGSTEDGRGMSMKRLQAIESQMRLVFAAVLGRLDESVRGPAQAQYNSSQASPPLARVTALYHDRSPKLGPNQKASKSPAGSCEIPLKSTATIKSISRVWTAEEVDRWLQTRPPAEAVALWLSGKASLKGLAEVCRARDVDGVGLLALLRPDELPPVVTALTGQLRALPGEKQIGSTDVDDVQAK